MKALDLVGDLVLEGRVDGDGAIPFPLLVPSDHMLLADLTGTGVLGVAGAGRFVSDVVAFLQRPRPETLFLGSASQEDILGNFENI